MNVVSLSRFRNKELVAILRELTELAERGQITAHAFVVKFGPNDHRAGVSGDYKRNPEEALTATFRMERRLRDDIEEPAFGESRM